MPLLGQSMLVTEALAGPSGVTAAVMDVPAARQSIAADPTAVFELIGPRLAAAERDYFRAQFQSHDSAVAGLLLRQAGGGVVIEGTTQEALAQEIGIYRETINLVLREFKSLGLIETRNRRITILDKESLRELSEL